MKKKRPSVYNALAENMLNFFKEDGTVNLQKPSTVLYSGGSSLDLNNKPANYEYQCCQSCFDSSNIEPMMSLGNILQDTDNQYICDFCGEQVTGCIFTHQSPQRGESENG